MKKTIYISLLAFLAIACGGGDDSGDSPIISKDYIDVPNLPKLSGDGQETPLNISSNCSWTITSTERWLTVTPLSGRNNGTVTVKVEKNPTSNERNAFLIIQGGKDLTKTVTIYQKGVESTVQNTLSANVTTLVFEAKGEEKSFTISSNTNWEITKPDWCTLSQASGSGNATIKVTATENTGQEQRSGQITIKGDEVADVTIAVSQKAKESNDNQEPGKDDNQPPS